MVSAGRSPGQPANLTLQHLPISLAGSSYPSGLLLVSGLDNVCHDFPKNKDRFKSTFNIFGNKYHYFDLRNYLSDLVGNNHWTMAMGSKFPLSLFLPPQPLVHKAAL